jgi:hypothetical protein
MGMNVRLADATDLDAVLAVDPAAARNAGRRQWLVRALTVGKGRVVWLALLDDAPAGFAVMGEFFSNPFLELIVTAGTVRRRGVASALMAVIEMTHAGRKIFVSTNRSNTVMQALLTARGYAPAGQVDHLDPGDPELFFVRLP